MHARRHETCSVLFVFALCLFVLANAACEDDNIQDATCDSPCYTGASKTVGVGLCRLGLTKCSTAADGTRNVWCAEQVLPAPETCDGLDNNCDALIDNLPPQSCGSSVGECRPGQKECASRREVCVGALEPAQETCDAKDNDCNGLVDDDVAIAFCYDGPPETVRHAPCRPGVLICTLGHEHCVAQILPTREVCTTSSAVAVDEDCNGLVDDAAGNVSNNQTPVDVAIILDVSCSMETKLDSVTAALSDFAARYAMDTRFRFYGYLLPGALNGAIVEGLSGCGVGGCDGSTFAVTIRAAPITRASMEPSYDAIVLVSQDTSWRTGSRFIFLFTDEEGQSLGLQNLESDAALAASDAGVSVYTFTTQAFASDFDEVGAVLPLESSAEQISDVLNETVPLCE